MEMERPCIKISLVLGFLISFIIYDVQVVQGCLLSKQDWSDFWGSVLNDPVPQEDLEKVPALSFEEKDNNLQDITADSVRRKRRSSEDTLKTHGLNVDDPETYGTYDSQDRIERRIFLRNETEGKNLTVKEMNAGYFQLKKEFWEKNMTTPAPAGGNGTSEGNGTAAADTTAAPVPA